MTSTQYASDDSFNKISRQITSRNVPNSYFKSSASPIKASLEENAIDEAFFDLGCSPSSTSSHKHLQPSMVIHSHDNSQSNIFPANSDLYDGECQSNNHFDNGNLENEYRGLEAAVLSQEDKTISADQVIELVSGISPSTSSNSDSISGNTRNKRQFPGPAGILPRLHEGLEGNPSLANLMRLHKGSDLKKFSCNENKFKNKSPTRQSIDGNL